MKHLRYYLPYVRKYIGWVFPALLFLAGDVWVATAMPWYMSEIVDHGVLAGSMETIRSLGWRMAFLALAGSLFAFLTAAITSILAQKINNDMRKRLFSRVHSLSFGQTDHLSPGTLVTRVMSDTQIVTQFGAAMLQMLLKPLALFVFGFIMMWIISRTYALVFAAVIPVQIVLMLLFVRRLNPLFTRIQLRMEKLNSRIQEALSSLRLIKVYLHQKEEAAAFRTENTDLMHLNLRIQYLLAIMNPLIMLLINVLLLVIIFVGGQLVRSGASETGRVIAAIMYVQQIMMSLMMMGQIYQVTAKAAVSCRRLEEIDRLTPRLPEGETPLQQPVHSLCCREITFSYPGAARPALTDIDLDLTIGGFTALVGPTGSGKSTLAFLLARYCAATEGTVLLNDRDILQWTGSSVGRRVVMVLQKSALCTGTIADNIRYGLADATDEDVRHAAEIAQADRFISALPQGYDTPVAQQGASLSGGQKQCVALARALLRNPEVLILDDSTSSLDMITELRFRTALRQAFPQLTLVVIAQRIATVEQADQILLLEEGRIAARGTHRQLLEHPLYQNMARSQQAEAEAPECLKEVP